MSRIANWTPEALAKFIVLSVVVNFVSLGLVAWLFYGLFSHVDSNTDGVARNTADAVTAVHRECLESRERAVRLNDGFDVLAALELQNTADSVPVRDAWVEAYRSMKREPVPECD